MRQEWPHAPPHYFTSHGTYIVTAATLHRQPLFNSGAKLDLLRNATFELARDYTLSLQAWAFFPNHYHLVISFENANITQSNFVRHLHRELAMRLNRMDETSGRRVMYEFWDTHLTFERSWLARLNYVHQNPVKHGLVSITNQYKWCSASWFETNARAGFINSVYSFKIDRSMCQTISKPRVVRNLKSDARTRAHSQSLRETVQPVSADFARKHSECDAFRHKNKTAAARFRAAAAVRTVSRRR